MKIALDPTPFHHTHGLLELPRLVAELGFEHVQLTPHRDFIPFYRHPRADDDLVRRFRRECDAAGITLNKNAIPFDPAKPAITSGIRLGTPAATTRGFGEAEFREVGRLIGEVLDGLARANSAEGNAAAEASVKARVLELCGRFPIYRN